ncbi:MAG: hypothetical protein WEA80_01895, partial [Gemmatimonadaceae bacterium]
AKAVNRLLAKVLAGDANSLDGVTDGTTYKRITGVSSGLVQTGSIANASVTKAKTEARNRCRLTNGSNWAIPNSTIVTLSWNTETYDNGGLHDNATSNTRITVPTGGDVGVWILTAQISWDNNTTGYRNLTIRKNSTTNLAVARHAPFSSSSIGLVHSLTAYDDAPAVGDFYEINVQQDSGGERTVATSESFYAAVHLW